MGMTVQQLGEFMSAQEFCQHYLLEQLEPLHPAAQWRDPDASAEPVSDAEMTVEQIMDRARQHGMVS